MGDETADVKEEAKPEVKAPAAKRNPAMEIAMLKSAMDRHNQALVKECVDEVNAVLQKHGCELVAVPSIRDGIIVAGMGCRLRQS